MTRRQLVLRCAMALILLVVVLQCTRKLALSLQQNRLRAIVVDTSRALRQLNITYWWDFGTLLGIVREGDIIWTETDADISVMVPERDRIWNDPQVWATLQEEVGFVRRRRRDAYKLRMTDNAGFFLDMDVWDHVPDEQGQPDNLIRMVTGRRHHSLYTLPKDWYLPVKHVITMKEQVPVSIPNRWEDVLVHWYGDNYMTPIKYYKGKDKTSDPFEQFMWTYAVAGFEVLWSFKVIARAVYYGFHYRTALLLGIVAMLVCSIIGCALFTLFLVRPPHQPRRNNLLAAV